MNTARHIKLLAAVTIVLLTLSGFSPARSSGGSGGGGKGGSSGGVGKSRTSGGSGGGGGCSSKKSGNHSDYDSDSDSGGSSSSGSSSGSDGRTGGSRYSETDGRVVSCATAKRPSAIVQLKNPGADAQYVSVQVDFDDADGTELDSGSAVVKVPGSRTKRVKVPMTDPAQASKVRDCQVTVL